MLGKVACNFAKRSLVEKVSNLEDKKSKVTRYSAGKPRPEFIPNFLNARNDNDCMSNEKC